MKRSHLFIALRLTAVIALASCSASPADRSTAPNSATDSIEAHIQAVENDLHPIENRTGAPARQTLAERMSYYKVPAVSVALINDYQIEWVRAWGVTESRGNQPATQATLFQAGSISKPVAAMAVMHLVQEGKLTLDANVNEQLRTWKVADNEFTRVKPVILRELLSHSAGTTLPRLSGIQCSCGKTYAGAGANWRSIGKLSRSEGRGYAGDRFKYSGGGYEIIHQLVLDVTNEPFSEFMLTTVLQPLGMNHSTYQQPLPVELQANAASGTFTNGTEVPGKWNVYPELMAAGL